MKSVQVIGHRFDALPGHVTISARGEGGNLRIAVSRAVNALLSDYRLKHKQVGDFKISVVVISDRRPADGESIVPRPNAATDDALGVPRSWRDQHHD